jgi:hypothetical protein
MRIHRNVLAVGACVLAVGLFAWAQGRKAGLWQVTSNMSWQQSPFPAGMPMMGAHGPGGGNHTTKICVTQEQIDKYGAVPPRTQRDCQITNIVKRPNGMTAEMVCTGSMSGKGTIVSTWVSDTQATNKLHFVGTMAMGADSKPVEWTVESSSTFEGADCGKVKPFTER